jgi:transposase
LESRDQRIQILEELIKQSQRRQFSASSEKLPKDQLPLGLFNEAEEAETEQELVETTKVPAHSRRKKPRVSIPKAYPREEILYEIPEAERICPHDGAALKPTGTEDHEQLDIIPAQVKVIRHRRQKYVCPCCEQYHVTASKPKQPIEKSVASPGLLAY